MKKRVTQFLLLAATALLAFPALSYASKQLCPRGYRLADGTNLRFMGRRDLCVKKLPPKKCPKGYRYKVKQHNKDQCYNPRTRKYITLRCPKHICQTSTGKNCAETKGRDVCYNMVRFKCKKGCRPGPQKRGRDGCVCKRRVCKVLKMKPSCPRGYRFTVKMRFKGRRDFCVKRLKPCTCPRGTRYKIKHHNKDQCYNPKTREYSKVRCPRQICQTSTGRNCTETKGKDVCYNMLLPRCKKGCKLGKAVRGADSCVCKVCK